MTAATQELLARLTGFTPGPHQAVGCAVFAYHQDGKRHGTNKSAAHVQDPFTTDEELQANAQLYAAAPDLHRIVTEQNAEIARLTAENSGLAQMLEGQRIELAQARNGCVCGGILA